MVVGEVIFIGQTGAAAVGYFQVTGITGTTTVIVTNLANTAAKQYLSNSAPGTVFPSLSGVSPGGLQGPPGANGTSGAPTTATYITQVPDGTLSAEFALSTLATGVLKNTTVTGVLSIASDGTDYLSPTTGLAKSGNLAGLANLATSRTNLGLGSMAVQGAGAVAIVGGSIVGTPISGSTGSFSTLGATGQATLSGGVVLTPTGVQTLAAANLIAVAAGKVKVAGSGGAVTMTSTPTVALGTADGQEVLVMGTDDANTVTLQDNGSLAGSKLRLGAASRLLKKGSSIRLSWDATFGFWYETAFVSVV
jgi:hypothetical protein